MTTATGSKAILRLFTSIALSLLLATPVLALEVEISDGVNTITIVDDGVGDLNLIDPKVIDFDITTNPTIPDLDGGGRVRQVTTTLGQTITLSATPPNLTTTLKNNGAGALSITITLLSDDPFPTPAGAPLGWRLFYNGEVADPTPGNVDVTGHSAELFMNNAVTPLSSAVVPDINTLGDPPVTFNTTVSPGSDLAASATSAQVVATLTLGVADELRLPENPDTEGNGLQGAVFNHDAKCAFLMNKSAGSVATAEQKGDAKCVKDQPTTGGDATACVDGPDEKGDKAEAKLQTKFDDFDCVEAPAWGVNAGTCCSGGANDGDACLVDLQCGTGTCLAGACIGGAAQDAANEFSHDVFGASITIGADAVGKCQEKVFLQASKAIGSVWKKLAQCKKKNFPSIANDVDLATVCINPTATDPKMQFVKMEPKVLKEATKCEDSGVTPVAAQFPGTCNAAATPAAFATCLTNLARCRFCLGVVVGDDIDPGAIDCDVFDDTVANASCPP